MSENQSSSLQRIKDLLLNYLAAMSLMLLAYWFYVSHSYFQNVFNKVYYLPFATLNGYDLLYGFLFGFTALLPLFYLSLPAGHVAKSRRVWLALFQLSRKRPDADAKVAILATLVKFFFLPLAITWGVDHVMVIINQWQKLLAEPQFFPQGYWLLFKLILLVDVLCFLVAYSVEHPRLGNEIRSVEPTLLGWVVALMCYPPFNGMTVQMLGWYSADYPMFEAVWAQAFAGGLILLFMAIYASASVALNLKASNLTHRGIVWRGPYAWARHPAYAAKNLAWWVGSVPILAGLWSESLSSFVLGVLGVLGWSGIYYLRAFTEERHLSRDPEYQRYCQQVRYRFVPGVW